MQKFFKLFFVALFILGFEVSNTRADNAIDAVTGVFESSLNTEIDYTDISKQLGNIENYLKGGQIVTNDDINHYIKFFIDSKNELAASKKEIDKNIGFVQKRIEALGGLPETGGAEVEAIAKKRAEFNQEATHYKAKLAEVDILLAKIDELETLISNTRSKQLLGHLLDKQSPLIYPQTFFNSTKAFIGFTFDIIKSPVVWYRSLNTTQQIYVNSNIASVLLLIFLSFAVGLYLRLLIMRRFGYNNEISQPSYVMRVSAAFFVAIAYGAIPSSIVAGFILWMKSTEVFTIGFFGLILTSTLQYFLYIFLTLAVSRVIFAPYNGKWRLVNVNDDKAKKIKSALYLSIILIGMTSLLEKIATKSSYSLELINYLSIVSGAAKVFSFFIVSKRMFWEDAISAYNTSNADEDESIYDRGESSEVSTHSSKITFILSVISIGFFGLSLFGYPQLSSYLLNRFLLSFVLIGIFIIARKATIEILHRLLLLLFWTRNFKLRRKLIYKIDFWVGLLIDTIFVIVVILGLLSLWGMSRDVLFDWVRKAFFGFSVGGIEISVLSIMLGIAIFAISITLVRVLKKRLMNNILSKMDMDDGIKHSLASGFGFLGFVLAAIVSIIVMGGNLTNLALIAGALSFGIGLGLQNIVNNFVSGIILLFERPVKVGDWVVINNYEGLVKQVNIRATEVQIWNGSTVIIPNADFLANSVINYTLRDRQGRIEVAVAVAYGSDVDKVQKIMLEIANKNRRVIKKPEPYVVFMKFGSTSLDFELRCFTNDIMDRLMISSELRFEINRKFTEAGIALAIPQIIYRSASEAGILPFANNGSK